MMDQRRLSRYAHNHTSENSRCVGIENMVIDMNSTCVDAASAIMAIQARSGLSGHALRAMSPTSTIESAAVSGPANQSACRKMKAERIIEWMGRKLSFHVHGAGTAMELGVSGVI